MLSAQAAHGIAGVHRGVRVRTARESRL